MSNIDQYKEVRLHTLRNTQLFKLNRSNGGFEGSFLFEIIHGQSIYTSNNLFTMTIAFTAGQASAELSLAEHEKLIEVEVKNAYKDCSKSLNQETVIYELDDEELSLVKKAIIKALSSYPALEFVITVSNSDVAKEAGEEPPNKKVRVFIDTESSQDHLTRYSDSAFGHLTVIAQNRYQFGVAFTATIDEVFTPAQYKGGVCIKESIKSLNSIHIDRLKIAAEIGNRTDNKTVDLVSNQACAYYVDDVTRKMIKSAIAQEIKIAPQAFK